MAVTRQASRLNDVLRAFRAALNDLEPWQDDLRSPQFTAKHLASGKSCRRPGGMFVRPWRTFGPPDAEPEIFSSEEVKE